MTAFEEYIKTITVEDIENEIDWRDEILQEEEIESYRTELSLLETELTRRS